MALPRIYASFSRSLISRSSPRIARTAFLSARTATAAPQRQFTSSSWRFQEAVQNDASSSEILPPQLNPFSDEEKANFARSVLVGHLMKQNQPSQIGKLFKNAGFEIKSVRMKLNRFLFLSQPYAVVELANPEQAQGAIEKFNGTKSLNPERLIYVNQFDGRTDIFVHDEFDYWEPNNSEGIAKAVAPLLEGRRVSFAVVPPAWANLKQKVKARNEQNRQIAIRALSKYGLESVGPAAINWGDLRQKPRFLCFVDFATREGAERAARDLDNQQVEGLVVGLRVAKIEANKAHRIGQLDRGLLKQLQEKQLAPMEVDDEMLSKPYSK